MARSNRSWLVLPWTAGLLAVTIFLSACGGDWDHEEVLLQEDPQLLARARQVIQSGDRVPLREIASGDWDRVYVFPGPSLRESVENTVGAPIEMPNIYNHEGGGIIVFAKGDSVQRAVALLPYPFDGNGGTYGPDVTVAPPNPNAGFLKFTDTPRTASP